MQYAFEQDVCITNIHITVCTINIITFRLILMTDNSYATVEFEMERRAVGN